MITILLFLLHTLLFTAVFFIAPVLAIPYHSAFLAFLPLLALFTNQHWALLHECIHGGFPPNRRINNIVGRLLGIFFGASFTLLRIAHLLHHQVNRTDVEQLEIVRGKPTASRIVGYYFGLFFGLFLSEVIFTFIMLLPRPVLERIGHRFLNKKDFSSIAFATILKRPGIIVDIRIDALAILACLLVSFHLYAGYRWALLAFFAIRTVLVSFLDYVYHYGSPLGNPLQGYNLSLPPLASAFLLHFNLHGVHHRNPGVPWHKLPALFTETAAVYEGNYAAYLLRQLRGPIRDSSSISNSSATGDKPLSS